VKKKCFRFLREQFRIEVGNGAKEKLRDLFQFAVQLLYSLDSVPCITAQRVVSHTSAVGPDWRERISQYQKLAINANLST
jgi:hypothetical protein